MVQVASEPFGGTDLKPESSGNTQALNIADQNCDYPSLVRELEEQVSITSSQSNGYLIYLLSTQSARVLYWENKDIVLK